MAITLASVTFDADHTSANESLDEVGGRDARLFAVSGWITGESSLGAIHDRLDAILDAASVEDYSAWFSLRAGRHYLTRRKSFKAEVARERLVASFTLELEARDPLAYADAETSVNWAIAASGATLALQSAGNVYAPAAITLVATGAVVNPSFSDGARTIAYAGTVNDGETLTFDAANGTVTLDGADALPYTSGAFPQVAPEGTTLAYADDATSSHTATVSVSFRDRWW